MKKTKKITAILMVVVLMLSFSAISVLAASEKAEKGKTMLNGDWKSLDGVWEYDKGIFTVTGGTFTEDKKVGLQFTLEKNVRDFTIEYEVLFPEGTTDSDEVCVSFRTPKDSYLREGLIAVASKYGFAYNDMVNWNNLEFASMPAWGNWEYGVWHKVKVIAKGARVSVKVDDSDAHNAIINKLDPTIDAKYDNGHINLIIGSSDGLNALSKGFANIKNVKMTIGSKVYAYLESGITRPSTGDQSSAPSSQITSTPTPSTSKSEGSTSSPASTSDSSSTSVSVSEAEESIEESIEESSVDENDSSSTALSEAVESTESNSTTISDVSTDGKKDNNNALIITLIIIFAAIVVIGAVVIIVLIKKGKFPLSK